MDQSTDAEPPEAADTEPGLAGAEGAAEALDPFAAMTEVDAEAAAQLRSDWGEDFDRNIALARQAAAAFGDSPLRAALEEHGLGDDPRIVRVAAEIGRMMQRGSAARAPDSAAGRDKLEARLAEIGQRDDYWSPGIQREVREIYLKLYGDKPLATHRAAGDGGEAAP